LRDIRTKTAVPHDSGDWMMWCAHRLREVGQEALESSSAAFQSAAKPSQLPTRVWGISQVSCRSGRGVQGEPPAQAGPAQVARSQRKKPDVAVTPGSGGRLQSAKASQAQNLSAGLTIPLISAAGRIGIVPGTQAEAHEA